MKRRLLATCVVLVSAEIGSLAWNIPIITRSSHRKPTTEIYSQSEKHLHPENHQAVNNARRKILFGTLVATNLWSLELPSSAFADTVDTKLTEPNNTIINCLSDLPPLATDSVRIFLCRHGETENNRLGRIQGARVDPSLNPTGVQQAQLLGRALKSSTIQPEVIFHSTLQRAKETAEFAAGTCYESRAKPSDVCKTLNSIAEIDFGANADGQPAQLIRAEMTATYTAWALGELDVKMVGDGESGRDALERVHASLDALVEEASRTKTRCVAAVSHSVFLRVLLATLLDLSLFEASSLQQNNACINVVDLKKSQQRILTPNTSKVLGGPLASSQPDYELSIPVGEVVRVNECSHLAELS